MNLLWTRRVFLASAVYDAVLGVAFLVAHAAIYDALGITQPNHPAYLRFPALLLILFAFGFTLVYLDPKRHEGILWMGIGLKAAYIAVVLWHRLGEIGLPDIYVPFAWIDLAFLAAFIAGARTVARLPTHPAPGVG